MAQVEALRNVKRAEEEARRTRDEARRQAQDILRKAREDARAIEAQGRAQADAAWQSEMDRAAKAAADDKARLLKGGQASADELRAAASGPSLNAAVDLLLRRFNEKIRG